MTLFYLQNMQYGTRNTEPYERNPPEFGNPDKKREFRRLAMGPLLDDLQGKMYKKIKEGDNDPLKLHVYSTHDTALAGIAATLDVFDHRSVALYLSSFLFLESY